jgi:hypothetical protein
MNEECRKQNDEASTKAEARRRFVLGALSFLRHLFFVIRHAPADP